MRTRTMGAGPLALLMIFSLAGCAPAPAPRPVPAPAVHASSADAGVVQLYGYWDCTHARRDSLTDECFLPDPEQRKLVGSPCELHPRTRLMADTVAVDYGFVCSGRSVERPGLFLHSRLAACGGCVIGKPFTEVAYCSECRRVRAQWEKGVER